MKILIIASLLSIGLRINAAETDAKYDRPKRVTGGVKADIASFPYYAAVEIYDSLVGGGSIISSSFVLTAAHNFDSVLFFPSDTNLIESSDPNNNSTESYSADSSSEMDTNINSTDIDYENFIEPTADEMYDYDPQKLIKVRVGSDLRENGGSLHEVDFVKAHPDYVIDDGLGGNINDIALIRVIKPFTFDKTRQPIRLFDASVRVRPKSRAMVVGLGVTDGDSYSDHLMNATVWVADKTKCERAYYNKKNIPLPKSAFCAGGGNTRADTCKGDSGGPLVIMNHLAGITSFAKLEICGNPRIPALYTEVSLFRSWIEKYVTLP
ncbi:hypothetical protein QAD02_015595 [Eretmocerus hayati]|uniref:Uncharacterized protein n=1 Tax=Eretmocerus hayati TaxID=131215 RepID=A0ACC2P8N9_9HYME|nr:hypothetical protein QAD02_015595 [Eretmocerus hayati]